MFKHYLNLQSLNFNSTISGYWLICSETQYELGKKNAKVDVVKTLQLGGKIDDCYINGLGIK